MSKLKKQLTAPPIRIGGFVVCLLLGAMLSGALIWSGPKTPSMVALACWWGIFSASVLSVLFAGKMMFVQGHVHIPKMRMTAALLVFAVISLIFGIRSVDVVTLALGSGMYASIPYAALLSMVLCMLALPQLVTRLRDWELLRLILMWTLGGAVGVTVWLMYRVPDAYITLTTYISPASIGILALLALTMSASAVLRDWVSTLRQSIAYLMVFASFGILIGVGEWLLCAAGCIGIGLLVALRHQLAGVGGVMRLVSLGLMALALGFFALPSAPVLAIAGQRAEVFVSWSSVFGVIQQMLQHDVLDVFFGFPSVDVRALYDRWLQFAYDAPVQIDTRIALPSTYVRLFFQYGLIFAMLGIGLVVSIIKRIEPHLMRDHHLKEPVQAVSIAFGLSVLLLGWYDVHALVLIALVLLFLALWSAIYVLERAQIPHKMIDLKAHEWVSVLVTLGAVLLGGYGLAHTMAERYTQTINSIAVLEVDTIDDVRLRQQNPQALNPVASRHLAVIALGQVQQELAKEQYRVDLVTDGIAYAVAAANMATEQAPWDSANWLTLSTVYTQATLLSDDALRHAIDALTKAIDLKPHHPRLYVQRGNMYRAAEQYERAIDDYERAIKEDPQAIDPYLGASLAYEARGNTNAAIQVLAPLQEQLDSNIDVQFQLGRLLINRNEERDWENALFLLESVFESRPAYPGVRELLLEVYNQLGRGTDAARIRVTDS